MKRGAAWRQTKAYQEWVDTIFAPFTEGDFVRCAFCGKLYPRNMVAPCHILSAGAHPELRLHPLNGLPGDFNCHREYDSKSLDNRQAVIESIFPGRWALLQEASRAAFRR